MFLQAKLNTNRKWLSMPKKRRRSEKKIYAYKEGSNLNWIDARPFAAISPNRSPGISKQSLKPEVVNVNVILLFSLEMEEERVYNELTHAVGGNSLTSPAAAAAAAVHRTRTVSSPVPNARPLSPGLNLGEGVTGGVASAHLPRPVATRGSRSVSSPVPTPALSPYAPGGPSVPVVPGRRPMATPPQITPPPSSALNTTPPSSQTNPATPKTT